MSSNTRQSNRAIDVRRQAMAYEPCAVPGCVRPKNRKTMHKYCKLHHNRLRRYGSPTAKRLSRRAIKFYTKKVKKFRKNHVVENGWVQLVARLASFYETPYLCCGMKNQRLLELLHEQKELGASAWQCMDELLAIHFLSVDGLLEDGGDYYRFAMARCVLQQKRRKRSRHDAHLEGEPLRILGQRMEDEFLDSLLYIALEWKKQKDREAAKGKIAPQSADQEEPRV